MILYQAYEIPSYGNINANTIKKCGPDVETAGCAEALAQKGANHLAHCLWIGVMQNGTDEYQYLLIPNITIPITIKRLS